MSHDQRHISIKTLIAFNLLSSSLIALCDPSDETTLNTDISTGACNPITVSQDITLTGDLTAANHDFTIESDATPRTLNFSTFKGIDTGGRSITIDANLTAQNGNPTYLLTGGTLQLNADQNLNGTTSINSTTGTLDINYTPSTLTNTTLNIQAGGNTSIQLPNVNFPMAPATCTIGQITGDGTTTLTKTASQNGTLTTSITGFSGTISLGSRSGIIDIGNNGGTLANNVTIAGQAYAVGDQFCALSVTGPINLSGTFTLSSDNSGINVSSGTATTTMANVFTGGGQLAKLGSGTLELAFPNNYTGHTKLYGGTLSINSMSCLGTSPFLEPQGNVTLLLPNGFDFTAPIQAFTPNNIQSPTATLVLPVSNSETITISGNITSSGIIPLGVDKTGNGTLILSGNNTFNGPLVLQSGSLQLSGNNTFIAPLELQNGSLQLNADQNLNGTTSINSTTGTLDINYTPSTLTNTTLNIQAGGNTSIQLPNVNLPMAPATCTIGQITGDGTTTLTKTPTRNGTLTTSITGFSGEIFLSSKAGIIDIGNNGGTLANNVTIAGQVYGGIDQICALSVAGPININSPFTLNGPSCGINVSSGTAHLTSSTTYAGGGNLAKWGSGELVLDASCPYDNTLEFYQGSITISPMSTFYINNRQITVQGGSAATRLVINLTDGSNLGSTIQPALPNIAQVVPGANLEFPVATSESIEISGPIKTDMIGIQLVSVYKTGPGTLTLSGTNTYNNGLRILEGTVIAGNDSFIGPLGFVSRISDQATIELPDTRNINRTITILPSATGIFSVPLGSATWSGPIIGPTGTLEKAGAGTLIISSTSNTYGGGTNITSGTLQTNANNTLPSSGVISLSAMSTLNLNGFNQTIANLSSVSNTSTVQLGGATLTLGNANDTTFAGLIQQPGTLVKQGTGKLTLTQANTDFATTTINGGTIASGVNNALPVATVVTLNGSSTLDLAGFNQTIGNLSSAVNTTTLNLGSGTLTLGSEGSNTSFAGVIQGTGGKLRKDGTGVLSLSGANTYTNGTDILNGDIQAGAQNTLPSSGIVTLSMGTNLDLNDFSQTIGNLSSASNTATVQLGMGLDTTVLTVGDSSNTTFLGLISEMGSLVKQGSGTLILSSANTYSKNTTINAGTLKSGIDNALPTTTFLTLSGSGALDLTGHAQILDNITGSSNTLLTLNGATLTVGAENSNQTFAGTITDGGVAGNLVKEGTGKLTLTGNNTLNGTMAINDGILSGNSSSIKGSINIAATKLLELNQTTDGTLTATLIGGGNVSKIGSGSITIPQGSDSSLFTGTFNLADGLVIQNGQIGGTFDLTGASTLKGNGTFNDLTNTQGTISPGQSIGTITVLGNFVQDANGTLEIEVSPDGTSDLINITGTSMIDGALTLFQLPGIYPEGTVYTFMTAAGGITGAFSTYPTNVTLLQLVNSLSVILSQTVVITPIPISSLTGNASAIGNYLFCSNVNYTDPDLIDVITQLVNLPAAQFVEELNALAPSQFGALPQSTFQLLNNQSRLITTNLNQKFYAGKKSCYQPTKLSVRTWAEANGYHYLQNNAEMQTGYNVNNYGANAGLELIFPSSFSLSFSGMYDYSKLNWKKNGGDALINTGLGSLSLSYFSPHFTTSVLVTGGASFYDMKRKIAFGTINRTAKSNHRSIDLNAFASITTKWGLFNKTRKIFIAPEVQFGYTNLFENGFKEKGAGSINYILNKRTSSFIQPIGKIALFKNFEGENFILTPKVSGGYLANIYLNSNYYSSKFYNQILCEPNFKTQSWHKTTGQVIVNASLLANIKGCSQIYLEYEGTYGDEIYIQGGQINFNLQF